MVNKKELIRRLCVKYGYKRHQASRFLEQFLEIFKDALVEGDEVRLSGICTLAPKVLQPRTVWSNMEKRDVHVGHRIKLGCKLSPTLEYILNESCPLLPNPRPLAPPQGTTSRGT